MDADHLKSIFFLALISDQSVREEFDEYEIIDVIDTAWENFDRDTKNLPINMVSTSIVRDIILDQLHIKRKKKQ